MYYDVVLYFRILFENLRRSLAYARFGWDCNDYDHDAMLSHLLFKLKRLQHAMLTGHHENDKPSKQSISLCVRLLDKSLNKEYTYFQDREVEGKAEFALACKKDSFSLELSDNARKYVTASMLDDRKAAEDQTKALRILIKYRNLWWD